MKKNIFLFFIFSFLLSLVSSVFSFVDPILDSKYIKDGISSTPVKVDPIQFDLSWGFYKPETIQIGLAKLWTESNGPSTPEPFCSKWESYFSYTNNSIYFLVEDSLATKDEMKLNGKYYCLKVEDLGWKINYFLVASYPLNLIQMPSDSTSPSVVSITSNLAPWTYWIWKEVGITLRSDDDLMDGNITLTLTNNRVLTLENISGKEISWKFTIGDSEIFFDSTPTLNVKSISWFLKNFLLLEAFNFSLPTTNISTNGNIAIKTSTPSIMILDDVQPEAISFDFIQANVMDNSSDSGLDLKYALSDTQDCQSLSSYNTSFVSWSSFQITGTGSNWKYICFRVRDNANNTEYAVSSNKLNIKVESSTLPIPPPIVPILTGATIPTSPLYTWTISQTWVLLPLSPWTILQTWSLLPFPAVSEGYVSSTTPTIPSPINSLLLLSSNDIKELSFTPAPYSTGFIDIQDHFSKPYVEELTSLWVIAKNDNLFEPESFITRAEFLKMILKSQNIEYSQPSIDISIFVDLIPWDWKSNIALKWYELSITSWYNDKTFRPDATITRIEAVKFLIKMLYPNLNEEVSTSFIDIKEWWMKKYVNKAKSLWLVNWQATPYGLLFKPNTDMTRWEAAKIIAKALEK